MSEAPPTIRLVIDKVRVSGLGTRDTQRLMDAVTSELKRLAPAIAAAAQAGSSRTEARVTGETISAGRHVEASAGQVASAIVRAIAP